MNGTLLTRAGLAKLKAALEALKRQKRELSQEVGRARELGDLRENAEYHAAKERLSQVMGKIGQLETTLVSVRLVDDLELPTDAVRIGMQVIVSDLALGMEETYVLVGPDEADPSQGKISLASPLAQGLLGHRRGETVTVQLPKGTAQFKIVSIERAL